MGQPFLIGHAHDRRLLAKVPGRRMVHPSVRDVTASSMAAWWSWLADPSSRGNSFAAARDDRTVKRTTPSLVADSTKAVTPSAGNTKARSTLAKTACPSVVGSLRSPPTTSTGAGSAAFPGSRVRARTCSPWSSSAATRWRPTAPVAPVTRTVMCLLLWLGPRWADHLQALEDLGLFLAPYWARVEP